MPNNLPLLCRLGFHQWAPYTGIVPWPKDITENAIPAGGGRVASPHWAVWYTSQYCYRHETVGSGVHIKNRARMAQMPQGG